VENMVKCESCGADNIEDSKYCMQCGSSLKNTKYTLDRDICFGAGPLPRIVKYIMLIIGLLIIVSGISQILEFYKINFVLWPWVYIFLGLIIIYWVVKSSRNK
jgi:uncharacterized membrane protein YvbJ